MKRLIAAALLLAAVSGIYAQTVIPTTDEQVLPRYAITGNNTPGRLPYVCRLKLTGLTANSTYRYTTAMSTSATLTTTNGPGNFFVINNTAGTYGYIVGQSSGKSLAATSTLMNGDEFVTANRYGLFTTDASGNYTGWFCVVPTGNTVFAVGSICYFYVQVNNGTTGTTITQSFRTTSTVTILDYGTTSGGVNQASAFLGKSFSSSEDIVLLYDNSIGSGRPISGTWTENDGITTNYTTWYNPASGNGVEGYPGRWGAILPNINPNGILRIERRLIEDNTIADYSISADGSWGPVNTVNPANGNSAATIDSTASPLPVTLISFSSTVLGNNVSLFWSTSSEVNNAGFEVQRKTLNGVWQMAGFVRGNGTTNEGQSYTYTDSKLGVENYAYRLKQIDYNGNYEFFNLGNTVSIASPVKTDLTQNYPNPFNPSTSISFAINNDADVNLIVYDINGRIVSTLIKGNMAKGYHSAEFNGSNFASGIYFYRLEVRESGKIQFSKIMKMIMVK